MAELGDAGVARKIHSDAATLVGCTVEGRRNDDAVESVAIGSDGTGPGAVPGRYGITVSGAAGAGLHNDNIAYVPGQLLVKGMEPARLSALDTEIAATRPRTSPGVAEALGADTRTTYRVEGAGIAIAPDQACTEARLSGCLRQAPGD